MVVIPRLNERTGALDDPLRFLLVDRRSLFLAALAEVLIRVAPQSSIQTLTDSNQAVEIAASQPVDLLFCDARAEPLAGPEVAVRVAATETKTRVILLGDLEDQQLLVNSLGCGAAGFFTKDSSPDEFVEGVGAVLAGHVVVGRSLIQLSLARLAGKCLVGRERLRQLSEAERSILVMIGQAQSTRAIAAQRGISQKTVRTYLANIYRKLEVENRHEAIVWTARAGLTEPLSPVPAAPA